MPTRSTRPPIQTRRTAWGETFRIVLEEMVRESKQPDKELVRMDFVATAASVAAMLVAGSELE